MRLTLWIALLVLLLFVGSCGMAPLSATQSGETMTSPEESSLIMPTYYPSAATLSGSRYSQASADQRCADAWAYFKSELVTSDGAVVHTDSGNVVSEGQSYGMMLAVQHNDKATFDRVWNWTSTYLQPGNRYGLFGWNATTDGRVLDPMPATDADVMIAMALFFASSRWGDGKPPYDYSAQAKAICRQIIKYEVTSDNYLKFSPDSENFFSTSYFMPAFFRLFAHYTGEGRWNDVADKSYVMIFNCLRPEYGNLDNGLVPNHNDKNGRKLSSGPDFFYDAMRTPFFIAVDQVWFGIDYRSSLYCNKIEGFFGPIYSSFGDKYSLSGTKLSGNHAESWIGSLAGGVMGSSSSSAKVNFFNHLMSRSWPTGQYRYFDICWQNFGLLLTSGNFKLYNEE
ncbi:MAG: hypothetical protein KKH83_04515 [Candidatus Margulisbacteria bacterium]|nr:hypothetical protein [Candidatus Margulisiibacteriota bacterium]